MTSARSKDALKDQNKAAFACRLCLQAALPACSPVPCCDTLSLSQAAETRHERKGIKALLFQL